MIFILSIAVGLGTFFLAHGCTMKAAEACWKPHLAADAAFDLGDERDASHPQGVVAPTGGSGRAGSGNGSGRVQREGRSSAGRASSASAGVVPRFLFQGSGQSSGGYGKLRTVERRSHEGAAVELLEMRAWMTLRHRWLPLLQLRSRIRKREVDEEEQEQEQAKRAAAGGA